MRKDSPVNSGASFRVSIKNRSVQVVLFLVIVSVFLFRSSPTEAMVLKYGVKNQTVLQIQEWLYLLGYMEHEPTGYYGALTVEAVKEFQDQENTIVDGVVGNRTLSLLREKICQIFRTNYYVSSNDTIEKIANSFNLSVTDLLAYNSMANEDMVHEGQVLKIPSASFSALNYRGELMAWKQVQQLFSIGDMAKVTDVETGLSFKVYRHGGYLHADCEPYSAKDTAIMFAIYNGKWGWDRRAVIVEFGRYRIAGSINGQPHGRYTLKNNNFNGHFCLHFYQSRLHKNGKLDPTHQKMVKKAAGN